MLVNAGIGKSARQRDLAPFIHMFILEFVGYNVFGKQRKAA